MSKLALHWRILIGLVAGLVVGVIVNIAWDGDTWAALGVDDPEAYMAPHLHPDAMVPVLPEGVESVQELDPGDAALARKRPHQLTEEQVERLGLEVVPANQGAGVGAAVSRFLGNLMSFIGDLFIRALQFIAVPLVLFSLVVGASSLNDLVKLGRIGLKTVVIYLCTTALAITIGLLLANIVKPGKFVPEETREAFAAQFSEGGQAGLTKAAAQKGVSGWDQALNLIPKNPVTALANTEMLQVVITALILGIGLTLISREKATPIIRFCDGMTEVVIKLVNVGMLLAPYAVFALIVKVAATMGFDVLRALLVYTLTVLLGLGIMMTVVYPTIMRAIAKVGYRRFFKGAAPAQLFAFSSSSSAATLPITMECAEERIGVSEEVSSFVLPLGATVNMDGTALYQGVAAIFIAQIYNMGLDLYQQLTIILTATLASIGTAAVPSAGLIMLVIVLQQLKMEEAVIAGGIAILFSVDRLVDMCRTSCNVTGDLMVATVVAATEKELLSEEEVEAMAAKRRAGGLDEHPHEAGKDQYGVDLGGSGRTMGPEE